MEQGRGRGGGQSHTTPGTSTPPPFPSLHHPAMRPAAALLAVAALLASTLAAAAPPPLPGLPNPDLAGRTADYGALSQLVATVLLVREGGVDRALEAVPLLHDETHAYVQATSLLAANPAWGNVSEWKGLTTKQHALLAKNATGGAKNLTASDPLVNWVDGVQKKLNASGKLGDWDPAADPKVNKTSTFLNALGDKIVGNDTAWMDELNAKLAQYNIVVTGKSVAQPSKFANEAATIARSITGLSLAAFGVNFAPCLVSWSNTGVLAGVTGKNGRGGGERGVGRPHSFTFLKSSPPLPPPLTSVQALTSNPRASSSPTAPSPCCPPPSTCSRASF